MTSSSTSLRSFGASLVQHRHLIWRLLTREVTQRFQGSALGLVWVILTPLLTATIFTLVFSQVFQARWAGQSGTFDFALLLLVGMAVHALFAEAISRAPTLIVSQPSYVTKVVFPIEILPVVTVLAAVVNTLAMTVIVLLGQLLLKGVLHPTAVFLPLVLLPFMVFVCAATMLLCACGVFLRDLGPLTALLVTGSLFLTPIFFPLDAVQGLFATAMRLNPLTSIVEQSRTVLLHGGLPDFLSLGLYLLCALLSLAIAFWAFQRLRPGFADVL